MIYRLPILFIFTSGCLLAFTEPDTPCVKEITLTPAYSNGWCDAETRDYGDCADTGTYYVRQFKNKIIHAEGNRIGGHREGVWKFYRDGIADYADVYFHDSRLSSYSFDGKWNEVVINDTLSYETFATTGNRESSGLTIRRDQTGIWKETDRGRQLTGYGKYSEVVCDTHSVEQNDPPYMIIDTVICYQRKDSLWLYFDAGNRFLWKEFYVNGIPTIVK